MPGPTELIILLFILGFGVLPVISVWKIASKAGLSKWLGLTQLFPIVNLIGLLYIAFTDWPQQRD